MAARAAPAGGQRQALAQPRRRRQVAIDARAAGAAIGAQHRQAGGGAADAPVTHSVSPGRIAVAAQQPPRPHPAGGGDVDGQRPGGAGEVAADQRRAAARGLVHGAVDQRLEVRERQVGRQHQRQQQPLRPGRHRRQVAEVHRHGTAADRRRADTARVRSGRRRPGRRWSAPAIRRAAGAAPRRRRRCRRSTSGPGGGTRRRIEAMRSSSSQSPTVTVNLGPAPMLPAPVERCPACAVWGGLLNLR